jgi:hypothetical protein
MTEAKIPSPVDMSVLANRLSLIRRYNHALGKPGLQAWRVQCDFINGFMAPRVQDAFVAQCENMILARLAFKRLPIRTVSGTNRLQFGQPYESLSDTKSKDG